MFATQSTHNPITTCINFTTTRRNLSYNALWLWCYAL